MNILMFCYEYPPIGGGGGVGAQQYAQAFARKGHRVTMISSRAKGLPARETVRGVELIRVVTLARNDRATATFLSMLSYLVFGALYVLHHRRELKTNQVINTHFAIPTGPLAHFAGRLLAIPNVLTIIGGDIYDPSKKSSPHRSRLLRRVNHHLITAADRVVAISSDTRRRAQEHYHITRPIHVINYGFEPQTTAPGSTAPGSAPLNPVSFHPVPFRRAHFHLVAVGRLVARKGFDYLIRALAELPDDVVLLLIGDGPLRDDLAELAHQLNVTSRFRMLGYQSRPAIDRLLRQADAFVLCSLHEGLGIVVQEAMHACLPVVATDNGGQVDLIRPGRGGILVKPADSAALAAAVRQLREHPDRARAMGVNNRRDIAAMHIDTNCSRYLDLFDQLALAPQRPAIETAA